MEYRNQHFILIECFRLNCTFIFSKHTYSFNLLAQRTHFRVSQSFACRTLGKGCGKMLVRMVQVMQSWLQDRKERTRDQEEAGAGKKSEGQRTEVSVPLGNCGFHESSEAWDSGRCPVEVAQQGLISGLLASWKWGIKLLFLFLFSSDSRLTVWKVVTGILGVLCMVLMMTVGILFLKCKELSN